MITQAVEWNGFYLPGPTLEPPLEQIVCRIVACIGAPFAMEITAFQTVSTSNDVLFWNHKQLLILGEYYVSLLFE